jgi:diadenosine tetraphosphate (Ap4A) HIT family hydrolase
MDIKELLKDIGKLVYEDETAVAVLVRKGAVLGHIKIFPKKKVTYLKQLSDEESDHVFSVASMCSVSVFEYFGAQGTNIILSEGAFRADDEWLNFDVLPRKFDDGLNLQWAPRQLDEAEMKNVQELLSEEAFTIGKESETKEEPGNLDKPAETVGEEEENYAVKHLYRIP